MKKLSAIVLAAGLSSRMGENKLLMNYKGCPMSEYIFKNLKHNSMWLNEVLVVGRLQETKEMAEQYGFAYIHNSMPERGMGYSLALGVQAAGACDGFLLALADMPDLKTGTIHTLCESFVKNPSRITVPVYGGRRGNPVIFPVSFRKQLSALDGDKGGRDLIRSEQQNIARVQIYDAGILRDIDTKADFEAN